jgi:hypothetical protein
VYSGDAAGSVRVTSARARAAGAGRGCAEPAGGRQPGEAERGPPVPAQSTARTRGTRTHAHMHVCR